MRTFFTSANSTRNHVRSSQSPQLQPSPDINTLKTLDTTDTSPKSPEFLSLTTTDGQPISRTEVIERLKRGESPTWTLRCSIPSPKPQHTPPLDIPAHKPNDSSHSLLLPSPDVHDTRSEFPILTSNHTINHTRNLHSGDFWQERDPIHHHPLASSEWLLNLNHSHNATYPHNPQAQHNFLSNSPPASTSFCLPPTSPLVNSLTNTDLDDLYQSRMPSNMETRKSSLTFDSFPASASLTGSPNPKRMSVPQSYQAHQPQRSISIPHTPRSRTRGLSISSEHSPLHHAAMVGSYEESILLGRMSTTPSKPLTFVAQIGVLGKGKCKPSLHCPPHTSVSFPAVFYHYNQNNTKTDNEPSPYVGLIDVEHTFPVHDARSPPGGCYRIPPQGQLQIIIKTLDKTAVKLFLVPYDFSDMVPVTKTFIRQRCYSTGSDEETPISSPSEIPAPVQSPKLDKPILRYLIHLNVCCTARGRYYIYKSIRVVFANRVPDGKVKLHNEISYPEPKYSSYKITRSTRDSSSTSALQSSPGSTFSRRRSTPFAFAHHTLDSVDGITGQPGFQPQTTSMGLGVFTATERIGRLNEMDTDGKKSPTNTTQHNSLPPSTKLEEQLYEFM